jgi:hypothetical protein
MSQPSSRNNPNISRSELALQQSKKLRSEIVHDLAQKLSENADALSVATAVADLYLDPLEKILNAQAELNRAHQFRDTDDPKSKQKLRALRFKCQDAAQFLGFVDQVARGICACLSTGKRIPLEYMAKLHSHKFQSPSDEMRRQNVRLLMENVMLAKSLAYKMPLPDEFLRNVLEFGAEADLGNKIETGHSA